MKTKTFKLGEWAKGGVITVEITGKVIVVIGKDWDYTTGFRKSSNQSNAKEFTRGSILANDGNAYRNLYEFLSDLTTHYYTEEIIKWVRSKVDLSGGIMAW